MNIKFVKYNGIKGYARVMYDDVKDSDKHKVEVAYNGKDIKDLLEYLFSLESIIKESIEYLETVYDYLLVDKNFIDDDLRQKQKEIKYLMKILKSGDE